MLRIFKNLFRAELAKPLVVKDFFIKNIKEEIKYNLGSKNKNKIFYIIRRKFSPSGLFSNLTFVINNLLYANKKNYIPFVDMQNFPTIYNEKRKIKKTLNSWEYYFKQVTNYKLKNIYNSANIIFSKDNFDKKFSKNLLHLTNNPEVQVIKKKYIKILNIYLRISKKKIKSLFKKKKILGVLIRGTTQKVAVNHDLPIRFSDLEIIIKNIFDKEKCQKIFLVTEDLEYFNFLKKKFKNIILYNKSTRFFKNPFSIHSINETDLLKKNNNNFRAKLGKEILIDTIMLSNCDILLSSDSNVSSAAIFFNNKITKHYLITSDKNSSNRFLARWLWYFKNYFPILFGSIKYKIKKNNLNYKSL